MSDHFGYQVLCYHLRKSSVGFIDMVVMTVLPYLLHHMRAMSLRGKCRGTARLPVLPEV